MSFLPSVETLPVPAAIDAVHGVDLLFERAITTVEQQLVHRFTDGFGVSAIFSHHHFRDDLRFHLESLYGTLIAGNDTLFEQHSRWSAGVLAARSLPTGSLAAALRYLAEFFRAQLVSDASAPIVRMLLRGAAAVDSRNDRNPIFHQHQPTPMAGAHHLCNRLIQGDVAGALAIAIADDTGELWNYVRVATHLFQPALYRVGDLWENNRITVAQEHLATVTSQIILNRLYLTGGFSTPTGRRALFAAVDGNQHVMGLRMVADSFEIAGWSVQYLGSGVPLVDLIEHVNEWKPELVGLSAGLVQHLPALKRAVCFLRGAFGEDAPTIMIGGFATNQLEDARQWSDADLWCSDAEEAVAALR